MIKGKTEVPNLANVVTQPMKKHEQTNQWFKLAKVNGWGEGPHIVQPFNGEEDPATNDVSWSHGFTHFRDRLGRVGHCGTYTFEDNAVPVSLEQK
jgi:hypothetical protein